MTKHLLVTFFLSLLPLFSVWAGEEPGAGSSRYLWAGMDYKKIFDQAPVLAQFEDVLAQEGLHGGAGERSHAAEEFQPRIHAQLLGETFNRFGGALLFSQRWLRRRRQLTEEEAQPLREVIIDDHYSPQSSEDLNKALLIDFLKKKKSAMMRELKRPLWNMVSDSAILGAGSQIIGNSSLGAGFGSSFTLFVLIDTLRQNAKRFSEAFYTIYISPLGDPLESYERLYAERKRFLPLALQERIEDEFGAARKSDMSMRQVLQFANIVLNLPFKSKQLENISSTAHPLNGKLAELVEGFIPPIDDKIFSEVINHQRRFSRKATALESPKSVLYFQGPPGLGKTHIARKLACLLDAPLVSLTASSDPASIIGDISNPGSLVEALSRPEMARNAIIFIDEADRIINKEDASLEFFLPLLEPGAQYFYSPYLRASVDISHFCFILAGNNPIKDDAIRSRLGLIHFQRMSQSRKEKIANDIIAKIMTEKEMSDEDKNNEIMQEAIREIIDQDQDPGVRQLVLSINKLINAFLILKDKQVGLTREILLDEYKKII